MTRQQANFAIIDVLRDYVATYPDIRFGQALWNLNLIERENNSLSIKDPFYVEPQHQLAKIFQDSTSSPINSKALPKKTTRNEIINAIFDEPMFEIHLNESTLAADNYTFSFKGEPYTIPTSTFRFRAPSFTKALSFLNPSEFSLIKQL